MMQKGKSAECGNWVFFLSGKGEDGGAAHRIADTFTWNSGFKPQLA